MNDRERERERESMMVIDDEGLSVKKIGFFVRKIVGTHQQKTWAGH